MRRLHSEIAPAFATSARWELALSERHVCIKPTMSTGNGSNALLNPVGGRLKRRSLLIRRSPSPQ